MNDDSFHLTPLDVRRFELPRAMRGYDIERVNRFREQVAEEIERLLRVNQDLENKARNFHEQLRAFRERDKALNDALVSAQQLRAEIREQAEREAQLILREARAEGERLVDAARAEVRRVNAEIEALERAHHAYVAQLRMITQRHLAEIDAAARIAPARKDNGREEGRPAAEARPMPEARPAAEAPPRLEPLVNE